MLEIQKNNQTIQLRNLQEQVQKNKEDIANHYNIDRVLADFGIKVVGSVDTASELPDPIGYSGNFGDAFAVGTEAPYSFYIYTRPDVNSGHPDNYWLDIGPLGIVGPEGPKGDQGPQGPRGEATKMYASTTEPANAEDGDLWLNSSNGNISSYSSQSGWNIVGNLRGPQGVQGDQGIQGLRGPEGPQGPKGDTGDVGGFININGILSNTDQLPTPASLNDLTRAYLIGASSPYDLYIQVGSTSDTAVWTNMGILNVATYVTVNGVYQNTWNADTKLDAYTTRTPYQMVYGKERSGTQAKFTLDSNVLGSSIVKRTTEGQILVPEEPTTSNHATSKSYVDNAIEDAVSNIGGGSSGGGVKPYKYYFLIRNLKYPTSSASPTIDYITFAIDVDTPYTTYTEGSMSMENLITFLTNSGYNTDAKRIPVINFKFLNDTITDSTGNEKNTKNALIFTVRASSIPNMLSTNISWDNSGINYAEYISCSDYYPVKYFRLEN